MNTLESIENYVKKVLEEAYHTNNLIYDDISDAETDEIESYFQNLGMLEVAENVIRIIKEGR